MHIQATPDIVWHSYTKVRAGITYGIISKRVNGVPVLTLKQVFKDRKQAKKASDFECQRLATEITS